MHARLRELTKLAIALGLVFILFLASFLSRMEREQGGTSTGSEEAGGGLIALLAIGIVIGLLWQWRREGGSLIWFPFKSRPETEDEDDSGDAPRKD